MIEELQEEKSKDSRDWSNETEILNILIDDLIKIRHHGKRVGTGLGLLLSSDIITKGHHGEMKVSTKEGEYAEFSIFIPLSLA